VQALNSPREPVRRQLHYLNFKKTPKNNKKKRADERRKQKEAQANSTYEDYNWVEMFHARTLNKCTVAVLAFFLEKHSLM
jgi:hypothetical protein